MAGEVMTYQYGPLAKAVLALRPCCLSNSLPLPLWRVCRHEHPRLRPFGLTPHASAGSSFPRAPSGPHTHHINLDDGIRSLQRRTKETRTELGPLPPQAWSGGSSSARERGEGAHTGTPAVC